MVAVLEEEGVLLDLPVQVIAGDQVQTMAVHVVLCMIGIVDRTGGGVLIMAGTGVPIMAGTGVLNMADTAGIVFEGNFISLAVMFLFSTYLFCYVSTVVHQCEGRELR